MTLTLAKFPTELILHLVSFLTRETVIDWERRLLAKWSWQQRLVPDLPSISALSQTNLDLHHALDKRLYDLCASVEPLGKLALLFAVEHELDRAVDKLVAAGVSIDSEFAFAEDPWGKWRDRCSLLHIAAAKGLRTIVVKLLETYGEVMIPRVHRHLGVVRTPLDRAAFNGHLEVVSLLAPIPIRSSAIYDIDGYGVRYTHQRCLSLALIQSTAGGNQKISQYLLSQGANIKFVGSVFCNGSPLYYASGTGNLELVQLLLASGADPNLGGPNGLVPLFNATSVHILQALLAAGADIDATDTTGRTALTFYTDAVLLRFFLERGADPNLEDSDGYTPLHYVAEAINPEAAKETVELLLQFGATVDKVDQFGQSAVEIVMERGKRDFGQVVEVLEPYVQNPDLRGKILRWWVCPEVDEVRRRLSRLTERTESERSSSSCFGLDNTSASTISTVTGGSEPSDPVWHRRANVQGVADDQLDFS
ncbi:ankyrin repeat-containing domain protein [Mycena galopus ATCC 62051]|nr:ankyrin repeat-containing domain protein [Mycena galopus ATCC 62051]